MRRIKGRNGTLRTSLGRVVSYRRLLVLMIAAGALTALLAGGQRERPARAAAAPQATPTPTPTPPPGSWTKCADEGGTCSFTGTKRVRYGANDTYSYGTFTTSVQCSNAIFGDPIVGTAKECYYQSPLPPPASAPDYSGVDDFLNGRRNVLRNDDFVIGFTAYGNDGVTRGEVFTARTSDSTSTYSGIYPGPGPQVYTSKQTEFATGRFFNTGTDNTVQVLYDDSKASYQLRVYEQTNGQINPAYETPLNYFSDPNQSYYIVSAVADFNSDGYDDIALAYDNPGRLRILTAADVNNPTAGFKLDNPEYWVGFDPSNYGFNQLTVGDFNGDGRPELAAFSKTSVSNPFVTTYSVDPKTLVISAGGEVDVAPSTNAPITLMQITAGQFTGAAHDQLFAAYMDADGSATAKAAVIDFDAGSINPKVVGTWDSKDFAGPGIGADVDPVLRAKAAHFDWSSNVDQVVWMVGSPGGSTRLSVLQIDPVAYSVTRPGDTRIQPEGRWHGMDVGVGNFDKKKTSPLDPTQKVRDPDLQIGVMGRDVQSYDAFLNIYDVDPVTFAISYGSGVIQRGDYFKQRFGVDSQVVKFWLLPTDLQGRSYRLGAPTKVTIDNATQPSVVIAAPPMHVDFATAVGQTAPTALNVSAIPGGFFATYDTDETAKDQSSSTNGTSWSFGARETVGYSITVGNPKAGDGITASDTFTAAQDLKGSSEKEHGSYGSQSFDVSVKTGFADQIWYTDTRFNIWVYPVLGKTVCPAAKPDCQDSEKVPLTVQFSGPDQTSNHIIAANQVEWYQPLWEYGNILSYPGSYAQLQQTSPDVDLLTAGPGQAPTLTTDAGTTTVKTTWATGTTDSQSTSLDQNYSFENKFSIASTQGVPGLIVGNRSFNFDVSGSFGFNSLSKSTTELGKSTGVGLSKPGTFLTPSNYAYNVTPFILGQKQPGGLVDNRSLSGDVQTFGMLRTAAVVDPIADEAGGWWRQAYSVPDVALNHPNRWQISSVGSISPIPSNCRPTGTGDMDCAEIADMLPNDPALSGFHDMRGLFISSAAYPGQGPQLEDAKAGDKLTLQARVYNYSLAAMKPTDRVHVRFYGMEWNNATNCPAGTPSTTAPYCPAQADAKPSFLIGENVLAAIPPFSSDPDAPLNSTLARADFDTTPYQDKYLAFWVVVWTEKTDGTLATEIAGHGLTKVPGALKTLGDVPVETATDGTGGSKTISYSNNVGFYKKPFYIFAPTSDGGAGLAAPPATEFESGDVRLGQVKVSERKIAQGQATEVSALVRTRGKAASGLSVVFYDGDPAQGGKAFDVERIPHIRARDAYHVRVPFRSSECGEHQIFVTVGKGRPYEVTDSSRTVTVQCAPPPQCTTNCFRSPQYYLNNLWSGLPRGEVWIAGTPAPVNTRNVYAIGAALKGGNSAQQSFNREYVAAQLSMLAADLIGERRREVLASTLACYGWGGAGVVLTNGATVGAATSLRELMGQAEWAARAGRRADWEKLAGVLGHLNSDDPGGACSTAAP